MDTKRIVLRSGTMDIILILISLLINVVVLFIIFRHYRSKHLDQLLVVERMTRIEANIASQFYEIQHKFVKEIHDDFDKLNAMTENRLLMMNQQLNESFERNLSKTNDAFLQMMTRLAKIDQAQQKIDALSTDIVSLQSILTDKKVRGIFGEVQLENILVSIFGEKNDSLYKMQYTLVTNVICDAVMFAPQPLGTVAIDSKFPLENYRRLIDLELDATTRESARKLFINDVKKHIDDIATKYIIVDVTSDQALMFIPAEAVFAYINAYCPQVIEYAQKHRVWVVSPTTLTSTLTTIQVIVRNIERDKYAKIIHEQLNILSLEFSRYRERWERLSKHLDSVNKDVREIHVTTDKITRKFDSISKVDFSQIEKED